MPYILLSVTDDNGNPLNQLLPPKVQKYVFNLLWGSYGNSIIVTPLLGILTNPNDYGKMIEAFHQRQKDAIDRKSQPIMAIVPPSYTLIDPKLIKKYWSCGVRIFGYNCENRKYGAFGYILESLHNELSELSKESGEKYIINGINSKFKYGKSKTSRIHNILGTGFGFDIYSPNHVATKFFSTGLPKRYVFNDEDYGFINTTELEDAKDVSKIINTSAFAKLDLSELKTMADSRLNKICKAHDIEKTIKEIEKYPSLIEKNKLFDYLSLKERIQTEKTEIESMQKHPEEERKQRKDETNRSEDEDWFK